MSATLRPLLALLAAGLTTLSLTAAQGRPIGFEEAFAFAENRAEAIARGLVPGSQDAYFYRCLLAQHEARLADVDVLLGEWRRQHETTGLDPRFDEIAARQALLVFGADPERMLEYLRRTLRLSFDHAQRIADADAALPARLDPNDVSAEAFARRALADGDSALNGVNDSGLAGFAARALSDNQRRALLSRLSRPDLPGLATLVVQDLAAEHGPSFGALTIHRALLLEQLEECASQRPELLHDEAFVMSWVRKLAPGADERPDDPAVRRAHLERLDEFTTRLASAFDGLRAHVLAHLLALDLAEGRVERGRFLRYLRLHRPAAYAEPTHLQGERALDVSQDWGTGWPVVRDDEALVRAALAHVLVQEDSFEAYVGPVRRDVLAEIFAESKLLAGVPDPATGGMERWTAMLPAARVEALEARVELDFPRTQKREFVGSEPVVLDVDVKHVSELTVRTFEVDTLGHFAAQLARGAPLREVDTALDLDGLIPHSEQTVRYDAPPMRRVRRSFTFDDMTRPGVYVVELLGEGLASRAVIRRGRLTAVQRIGAAGHVFQVLNERGVHLKDAAVSLGGREFAADADGEITVPFTTDPGRRAIVLRHGDFGVLDSFEHASEEYGLEVKFHVDREALLVGHSAPLLARTHFTVAGERAALALLQDVALQITATDHDGAETTSTVRDFALTEDREVVHELRVPPRTRSLSVRMTARVQSLSRGAPVDLASEVTKFPINGIDATFELTSAVLIETPDGYALDILGKNGEPRTARAALLSFEHEDFRRMWQVRLAPSPAGRIELGRLPGIRGLMVQGLGGSTESFSLRRPRTSGFANDVHLVAGERFQVPYGPAPAAGAAPEFSVLEVRGNEFVRRHFPPAALRDGRLELSGLAPGDYSLAVPRTGETYDVRVTTGGAHAGHAPAAITDATRRLELSTRPPLAIARAELARSGADAEALVIELAGASTDTRVHVFATRYVPAFDPHRGLALDAPRGLDVEGLRARPSLFEAGRQLSDEYRYILDRRRSAKFPGNMLARAGVLLNPWVLAEAPQELLGVGGGGGGAFGGRGGVDKKLRKGSATTQMLRDGVEQSSSFANLDFLAEPSTTLANLVPDAQGRVGVPLAALGQRSLITIVAVGSGTTVSRTVTRAEAPLARRDVRLAAGLDPARSFTQRRRLEYVPAGARVVLADAANADAETFETLASVFQLYRALGGAPELERFAFLMTWPSLSPEEKRAQYSEFACHEVEVFLHEKDPEFFAAVVRPYLAHKADKDFLDRWLLGEDLARYGEPWAFAQLNVVERILLLRGLDATAARHVRDALELLPPDAFAPESYLREVFAYAALATPSGGLTANLRDELKSVKDARDMDLDTVAVGGFVAVVKPTDGPAESLNDGAIAFEPDAESVSKNPEASNLAALREKAVEKRKSQRSLFRALEDTQELAERYYWRVPRAESGADLVTPSPFWLDFAETPAEAPFVSAQFPLARRSLNEMLLALAFLDLPFEATPPTVASTGGQVTLTAGSGLFIARQEIVPTTSKAQGSAVLVGQDFFRLDEPFTFKGGEQRDRFITDEFVRGVAYGCRVVVTNPTSTPIVASLLLQIPRGAVPLRSGFVTRGVSVTLDGYGSHSREYAFYFPVSGTFAHYPLHVSREGELLASVAPRLLDVVDAPSAVDTQTWEHLSQAVDLDTLVAYLDTANLGRLDLAQLAWRMRERGAFQRITALLSERRVFEPTLWSYAVLHRDVPRLREFLAQRDDLVARLGTAFASPLLTVDPVERRTYEHLEYEPLVNGRAHPFGPRRVLLNDSLWRQYQRFLGLLAYHATLTAEDRLAATYYLFLQDRVSEALAMFERVDPSALESRLQYDYMSVYAAFYRADIAGARAAALRHAEHPVTRWRARFQTALAHLDEAAGQGAASALDPEDRAQQLDALAATEASLEVVVDGDVVTLTYANIDGCEVRYRPMDVELLFSTNPFMQGGSSSFSSIKPNRTEQVALPRSANVRTLALPAELAQRDLSIEVRAGGLVRRAARYASGLSVQVLDSYGQVQVRRADTRAMLPRAYVKVYARLADGTVRFHKDGYTDLRGRFDYVSRSGPVGSPIERFALFVQHDALGAEIREAAPPGR